MSASGLDILTEDNAFNPGAAIKKFIDEMELREAHDLVQTIARRIPEYELIEHCNAMLILYLANYQILDV